LPKEPVLKAPDSNHCEKMDVALKGLSIRVTIDSFLCANVKCCYFSSEVFHICLQLYP